MSDSKKSIPLEDIVWTTVSGMYWRGEIARATWRGREWVVYYNSIKDKPHFVPYREYDE